MREKFTFNQNISAISHPLVLFVPWCYLKKRMLQDVNELLFFSLLACSVVGFVTSF